MNIVVRVLPLKLSYQGGATSNIIAASKTAPDSVAGSPKTFILDEMSFEFPFTYTHDPDGADVN